MDVHEKLTELATMIEEARAMPMSASCMINRAEVLELIDQIRQLLPEEFHQAEQLLADKQAVVGEARREAERLLEQARQERTRLLSQSAVTRSAKEEAEKIRQRAKAESRALRKEVDDYVDTKLANFEVVLDKTLQAVQRGREKLAGRVDVTELGDHLPEPGELAAEDFV